MIVLELHHLIIWVKECALSWHYKIKSELNFLFKKYEKSSVFLSLYIPLEKV